MVGQQVFAEATRLAYMTAEVSWIDVMRFEKRKPNFEKNGCPKLHYAH
jgi:1,4-dihydroxy-2-naphthoyl-CoA synthase